MSTVRVLTLLTNTRRLGASVAAAKPWQPHSDSRRIGTNTRNYSEEATTGAGRDEEHVNHAARELGVTGYYCNRNPRSLELLGMAEKPKGFQTARRRVDYYHR